MIKKIGVILGHFVGDFKIDGVSSPISIMFENSFGSL